MAVQETILQHWVLTKFVYPFLLIFVIIFGILQKTKLFGEGKKQLDAVVAFVAGLIFVAAVDPTLIVDKLVLFLSVAIVIVFVVLLLWGFVTGGDAHFGSSKPVKIAAFIVIILAVIIAMFLITGIWDTVIDTLFRQNWSEDVWTNILFLVVLAAAIAAVVGGAAKAGK